MSKRKPSLSAKVRAHLEALERGKHEYKRADALMAEILERLKPGDLVTLHGGRKAKLKDNFADQNTVFRAHGIRRFEIEVVEP